MNEDQISNLLSDLVGIDTHDINLRDHPDAYAAVEAALAPLLEDLAAHEASNRIRGEDLETLRAENAKLREALGWSAAVLQCLVNDSLSDSSTFTVNGEKRSLADVLDLADAALGESNG